MNPFTAIPPHVRRWLYLAWGTAGLAAGALGAYTSVTPADDTPSWLGGAVAVIATVGTALGFTAAANTVATTSQKDAESPTGEVAGEASDLPAGTPTEPTTPAGPVRALLTDDPPPPTPTGWGQGI